MSDCTLRHHADEYAAQEHIEKYHRGRGYSRFCDCGQGYVVMGATKKTLERTARHYDNDRLFRQCYTKGRYPTEKEAYNVIRKRDFDGRAYACTACGGWHITKQKLRPDLQRL